jgi:NADP-dependent 3-hydroxy acid dehydrogenase YdfG
VGDVVEALDVTDPVSCDRFVEHAVDGLGGLDVLVNAAGLALGRTPFDESTEEDERAVLEANVNGLIRMTRLCLSHIRDGGHIVNLGSVAGRQAYENGALYITSKFAVRGFTYALREDLLGRPIRVTTVDPGLVETEFSIVRDRRTSTSTSSSSRRSHSRPGSASSGPSSRPHHGAHHPRRLDLLHLRRARRHRRREDERLLRA